MYPGPARQLLGSVIGTAQRLGATMPKAITEDYNKLTAVTERARTFRHEELSDNLGTAVVAALEAGSDPLTDPGVAQAVIRRTLYTTEPSIESALGARAHRCLEDHAVAIVTALRDPFDRAAATIAASFDTLGDLDLSDTRAVVNRGGDAAGAWSDAQTATKNIDEIRQAWKLLAQATSLIPWEARHGALVIAAVPAAAYIDQPIDPKLSAWDAARHGWPLELATPDTYRERLTAVTDEQARRQAHADGDFGRAYQRSRGVSLVG